jgi:hypothetical protein
MSDPFITLGDFEIRNAHTSMVLGSIRAESAWHAAQIAAMRFYSRTSAQRVTGWTGGPGMFEPTTRAFDSSIVIYKRERFYIARVPNLTHKKEDSHD